MPIFCGHEKNDGHITSWDDVEGRGKTGSQLSKNVLERDRSKSTHSLDLDALKC